MEYIIQIRTTKNEAHVTTFGPAPDGHLPHQADFRKIMPVDRLPKYLEQLAKDLDPQD